ncbi:MAG: biotin transporter BioY [Chloroflexi bacterium]|nr:biotin transporter BioY [Chloroflexota bacterium]
MSTVITAVRRRPSIVVSDALLIGAFTVMMWPAAHAKVEAEPVPYTLQVLMVLLAGLLLGPWRAGASMGLYAIIGFAGAPIFARGGGPAYFFSPSAGYIYGFVIAAVVVGLTAQFLRRRYEARSDGSQGVIERFAKVELPAALAGIPIIYIFGVNHLALYYLLATDKSNPWGLAWLNGAGIFIWYDAIKAAIAATIASSAGLHRER